MLTRLVVLFALVPIVELALLIQVGQRLGVWWTLAIVILTGLAGACLARHEGFGVVQRIKRDLADGVLPAAPLLDGALILAGGLLLLTPGLLTDVVGLLVLVPWSRERVKRLLKRRFGLWLASHGAGHTWTQDDCGPTAVPPKRGPA